MSGNIPEYTVFRFFYFVFFVLWYTDVYEVTRGAVYSALSREFKKQMFFVHDPSKNFRVPRVCSRVFVSVKGVRSVSRAGQCEGFENT